MKTEQTTHINIQNNKKSGKHLIGMLQNLYCSCQSELSAFLLLNYQSQILKKQNKKLSLLLEEISKQSLDNSHTLAQLILKEKGLPFYFNSQYSPLNAFWLQFDIPKENILNVDINFFKTLIENYTIYINKINKANIKKFLTSLKEINQKILSTLQNFN